MNLIAYFSRKGQNYWDGSIKDLKKGNTEVVAEYIRKAVGGDLFEIETVKAYDKDYYGCTAEAKKELYENARPELKSYKDVGGYDVIFVGYPNWWGTMPTAVFGFLERCDLRGKIIAPFCTNEGSGMGSSERDLKRICVGATIEKGLPIRGCEAADSEKIVSDWAKNIIDFYLMHAQSKAIFEHFKKCRAYEQALEFKKEGKIKHFGISFHDTAEVLETILKE